MSSHTHTDLTVAIRLSTSNGMPPSSVIDAHAGHARNHDGKVLFTTDSRMAEANFSRIKKAVILTTDGKTALTAEVHAAGFNREMAHDPAYTQPSQWQSDDKKYALELENVTSGPIRKNDYVLANDPRTDLLALLAGAGQQSLMYVVPGTP